MDNVKNTIKDNTTNGYTEKKSKFIATIFKVESELEAVKIINETKKKCNKASHNVYAYNILQDNGQVISRYSDDKEPKGTAGRPILFFLNQKNLYNVLVIVTRYFGGTLLGKSRLIRSYVKSVEFALENTDIIEIIEEVFQ